MTETLLITQTILAVVIVIFVLLQKSSSMGFGASSSSNDSLFGAKGPMNFLAKATFFVGFIFVGNTLLLGYQINQDKRTSIVSEFLGSEEAVNEAPKDNIKPVAKDMANETPQEATNEAPTGMVNEAPAEIEKEAPKEEKKAK